MTEQTTDTANFDRELQAQRIVAAALSWRREHPGDTRRIVARLRCGHPALGDYLRDLAARADFDIDEADGITLVDISGTIPDIPLDDRVLITWADDTDDEPGHVLDVPHLTPPAGGFFRTTASTLHRIREEGLSAPIVASSQTPPPLMGGDGRPLGTPEEVAAALAEELDGLSLHIGDAWWPGQCGTANDKRIVLNYGGPDIDRTVVLIVESVTEGLEAPPHPSARPADDVITAAVEGVLAGFSLDDADREAAAAAVVERLREIGITA